MKLKIGIIGTRGIPNRYGGFEQFAEYLSKGLVSKHHEMFVYNSHNHFYQEKTWNGVNIIHCYDPEDYIGKSGQFIYDFNCIIDARKRKFDVLLILGYTSISIWGRLFPKDSTIIINMDGLEWQRVKYSWLTQRFLLYAERLAVKFGNFLISDSTAIQSYLYNKYNVKSEYIAYGAEIYNNEDLSLLKQFNITQSGYYLIMARIEPENNIETILEGFCTSKSIRKMIIIGNPTNKFGKHLVNRFKSDPRISFIGAIYDSKMVHTLKRFSFLYFHGHSVGGTNPSLLEAMASRALIAAHDNIFNRAVLGDNALYFKTSTDVCVLTGREIEEPLRNRMINKNITLIKEKYSQQKIIDNYEAFLIKCHE